MSQLTLYVDGYFVNQYDASVYTALVEKGVEFSTARALLRDGGGVTGALAVHTGIGRVPTLQHGDFYLSESLAIIEYLEETFPPPKYPRLIPAEPRARARARQIMAYVRFDTVQLATERSWWMCVYPAKPPPLSPQAEKEARELVALAQRLADADIEWNMSHADVCLVLLRIARTGYPLPDSVEKLLAANLARPSLRAYIDHARPPNPPPRDLSAG
jgi:glutathione S-transferase